MTATGLENPEFPDPPTDALQPSVTVEFMPSVMNHRDSHVKIVTDDILMPSTAYDKICKNKTIQVNKIANHTKSGTFLTLQIF